jgi:hypothetical protein
MTEIRADGGAGDDLRALLFAPGRAAEAAVDGIRGVVVEVEVDGAGVDTVAAFADGTARYLNHSGAAVVWEADDPVIRARVQAMIAAAVPVRTVAGPGDEPVPARPGRSMALIAVLTDEHPMIGLGPFDALASDPVGGPVLRSAFNLMTGLMERAATSPAD